MSAIKMSGLVLKIFDFKTNDQIVSVLTKNKIINFIALGTRKINSKNRIAIQLGNIVEIEIFVSRLNNKLSKLKRATIIKQPPINQSDTAIVILQIINILNKIEVPSKLLLQNISESFEYLGGEFNHHVQTYISYKVLCSIGLTPLISACIECKRKDRINGFEFYKGGYTCIFHTKKARNIKYLRAIKYLNESIVEYLKVNHELNAKILYEIQEYINQNTI